MALLHPKVAFRDCETCKKYLFDEDSGEIERNPVTKELIERPKGTFPPCHYGEDQCPKVSPEAGRGLTDQNRHAYEHYQQCRAVGKFPADGIVRENAAVIRAVEDQVQSIEQQKQLLNILQIASVPSG